MQSTMQIPVEMLVQHLQQIPGLRVSVEYVDPHSRFGPDAPFEEWARYWLETYKMGVVKDNTYWGTYQEPVELHLIPYFDGWPLYSIKPADVVTYFKTLTDELSHETQKKVRNALRLLFEAAIEEHICFDNPVKKSLKIVSNVPPVVKNTWTAEQYQTAYSFALSHKDGLDIVTLMETAISRSELLGLHFADHDVNGNCLKVRSGLVYQKSTKTGKSELVNDGLKNKYRHRSIPISPLLNGLLALKPRCIFVGGNKRQGIPPEKKYPQYLFHSPDGGPYDPNNWYRRVLKRFMKDLNEAHPEVPILTTHELRHTQATLLKNEGRDLFSISRLLGHCDLNMLAKRYAHDDLEALRKGLGLNHQEDSIGKDYFWTDCPEVSLN